MADSKHCQLERRSEVRKTRRKVISREQISLTISGECSVLAKSDQICATLPLLPFKVMIRKLHRQEFLHELTFCCQMLYVWVQQKIQGPVAFSAHHTGK